MFEHHTAKLLPYDLWVRRLVRFTGLGAAIIAFGLGSGTLGYHYFAGFGWLDAALNASMILTGMGPWITSTRRAEKFSPLSIRCSAASCSWEPPPSSSRPGCTDSCTGCTPTRVMSDDLNSRHRHAVDADGGRVGAVAEFEVVGRRQVAGTCP